MNKQLMYTCGRCVMCGVKSGGELPDHDVECPGRVVESLEYEVEGEVCGDEAGAVHVYRGQNVVAVLAGVAGFLFGQGCREPASHRADHRIRVRLVCDLDVGPAGVVVRSELRRLADEAAAKEAAARAAAIDRRRDADLATLEADRADFTAEAYERRRLAIMGGIS